MSRALNNRTGTIFRNYGAVGSTSTAANSFAPNLSHIEFMKICEYIAHNINAINSSSSHMEETLLLIGTPKDSSELREGVHKINTKTRITIEMTLLELHRLAMAVQHGNLEQKNYFDCIADLSYNMIEKFMALQKQLSIAIRRSYQQDVLAEQDGEQHLLENSEYERQVCMIEKDVIEVERCRHKMEQCKRLSTENCRCQQLPVADRRNEIVSRQSCRCMILILLVIILIAGSIVIAFIYR